MFLESPELDVKIDRYQLLVTFLISILINNHEMNWPDTGNIVSVHVWFLVLPAPVLEAEQLT